MSGNAPVRIMSAVGTQSRGKQPLIGPRHIGAVGAELACVSCRRGRRQYAGHICELHSRLAPVALPCAVPEGLRDFREDVALGSSGTAFPGLVRVTEAEIRGRS